MKKVYCDICSKGPYSDLSLQHHMKQSHEFEKQCCGTKYVSYSKYCIHRNKHHNHKHCCGVCGKEFPKEYLLKRHFLSHNSSDDGFACSICNRKFSELGNMRRHIRQVHTDLKPYSCDKCDRRFGEKGNLNRHVKSKHLGVRDHCPHCNQTCVAGTLRRHIRTYHEKVSIPCPQTGCDKDFKTKYGLNSHVNSIHKAVPTIYPCEICGEEKLFSPQQKSSHKREKHSDVMDATPKVTKKLQWDCSFCLKKFDRRKNHIEHMEKIHDYCLFNKCELCGNKYCTQKRLEKHLKLHCKEKQC